MKNHVKNYFEYILYEQEDTPKVKEQPQQTRNRSIIKGVMERLKQQRKVTAVQQGQPSSKYKVEQKVFNLFILGLKNITVKKMFS